MIWRTAATPKPVILNTTNLTGEKRMAHNVESLIG